MKAYAKFGMAAVTAMLAASAAPASAATYSTYCESAGNPTVFYGGHPGRCANGGTDVGNDVNPTYNAGSFGFGQGLIFLGYGDNNDSDGWTFTATSAWKGFLDLFAWAGVGTNGGTISATLSDGTNTWNLSSLVAGSAFGTYAAGTYTLTVLGAVLPTDIYNYDLRVESVPVPAAAILFGTALAGAAAARRRRKTA